eukprot:1844411-Rhodomonas_salina.1
MPAIVSDAIHPATERYGTLQKASVGCDSAGQRDLQQQRIGDAVRHHTQGQHIGLRLCLGGDPDHPEQQQRGADESDDGRQAYAQPRTVRDGPAGRELGSKPRHGEKQQCKQVDLLNQEQVANTHKRGGSAPEQDVGRRVAVVHCVVAAAGPLVSHPPALEPGPQHHHGKGEARQCQIAGHLGRV